MRFTYQPVEELTHKPLARFQTMTVSFQSNSYGQFDVDAAQADVICARVLQYILRGVSGKIGVAYSAHEEQAEKIDAVYKANQNLTTNDVPGNAGNQAKVISLVINNMAHEWHFLRGRLQIIPIVTKCKDCTPNDAGFIAEFGRIESFLMENSQGLFLAWRNHLSERLNQKIALGNGMVELSESNKQYLVKESTRLFDTYYQERESLKSGEGACIQALKLLYASKGGWSIHFPGYRFFFVLL